jgi:methyl-accepting chemotaxis protein
MAKMARLALDAAAIGTSILLVTALIVAAVASGGGDGGQVDLLVRQQLLLQNLTTQALDLVRSESPAEPATLRERLGRAILQFDGALTALNKGGVATDGHGVERTIVAVTEPAARRALTKALEIWYRVGTPLADLAAGALAPQSVEGRAAISGLIAADVELADQLAAAAEALRTGPAERHARVGIALWTAAALAFVLAIVLWLRGRADASVTRSGDDGIAARHGNQRLTAAGRRATAGTRAGAAVSAYASAHGSAASGTNLAAPSAGGRPLAMPQPGVAVDLDLASASVDRLAVDMTTIAASTDKMRGAIDTAGAALTGLLDRLDELARDTDTSHRLLCNASDVTDLTQNAAREMSETTREIAQVVDRVAQLARHTGQVAQQVSADAGNIGRPGDPLGAVVDREVKVLAAQTSAATAQIEQTIAGALATTRRFEEAIGRIAKNVGAINSVAARLGELPAATAPTPLPAYKLDAPFDAAASESTGSAEGADDLLGWDEDAGEPMLEELDVEDPSLEAVADETSELIGELDGLIPQDENGPGENAPGENAEATPDDTAQEAETEPEPDATADDGRTTSAAEETSEVTADATTDTTADTTADASDADETAGDAAVAQATDAEDDQAAAEPDDGDPAFDDSAGAEPDAATDVAPASAPEPPPTEAAPAETEAEEDGSGTVFILSRRRRPSGDGAATEPATATPDGSATVEDSSGGDAIDATSAGADEPKPAPPVVPEGPTGNIFILNKPATK